MSPDHYADSGKEQSKELKRRMLHRRDDGDNKNGTKDGEDKPNDDDKDKKGDDDKDKNGDDDKNDDDDEDKQPDTTLVDGPLFQRYQFLSPGKLRSLSNSPRHSSRCCYMMSSSSSPLH